MKYTFILLFFLISTLGFSQQESSEVNKMTVGCRLIEKEFIQKNGEPAGFYELYLRCSVQDYFIKLCECRVSKIALEKYIDKSITVEVEIHHGNWDICQGDMNGMQSRIGKYAVITKIIETDDPEKETKKKSKKKRKNQ